MAYEITRDYISFGNARSGEKLKEVKFIVSHSTGNPGSTAYANRNYFNNHQPYASAHTFIDDRYILEIIPLDEKAWHVLYSKPTDNRMFGADANDAAIGVELCYGGNINFTEAYNRYVWYHAYLCQKFNLDPSKHIVSHRTLDPERRTDPLDAFRLYGITWDGFISDVSRMLESSQSLKNRASQVPSTFLRLPLKIGDRGPFVKEVQEDLIRAGFPLPKYGADGIFGEETERAVMAFQKQYGLHIDGLVGRETLTKLTEVVKSKLYNEEFPLPNKVLKRGDTGEDVKMVQRALKHLNFDPKDIDGIYGKKTENAVRRFQSMYAALKDDGIYGPNTRKFMKMELQQK
ncbi:peptidoglycan hydrolase-like protein with peptidoglycan-binding domain [Anoxybacillus calidus]|jgi:N-acetylmuramoyl-L-alanine amidase|uniref:N-acetylmuramoyl-L-alanine amidase n=2 Tax=[Anoxybacillus] calidus TaxID=575178 RepID=A0A7W0BWF5_9BACL|nr:peptidoglycan hydrolase-like protein with peptidoglycan-binding domain [Anoxybacillus calidus]